MPNTLRHRIDQASLPLMTRLNGLPKLLPFAILLTLLVGGVLVGGLLGLVLMCLAVLFVAWVLYLSWPVLSTSERLMRSAVVLLAVAMTIVRYSQSR